MIPSDKNQTSHETFGRLHGRLDQIDSRTDALNETKSLGSLHESFGSQGVTGLNPSNQRVGIDTHLHDAFFSFKRLVRMWFMCRRLAGSLG